MACTNCSSKEKGGCKNAGSCTRGCANLSVFDWLSDIPSPSGHIPFNFVEVRFKNSRKEFFKNEDKLQLHIGDIVVVEAITGYDVGLVSLAGELCKIQMAKKGVLAKPDTRKILRIAEEKDVKKWKEATSQEQDTMHKAREFSKSLGLQMKISDVEYQGDKSKAIFYYTSEVRVDFRELIKMMADKLKVRIEMKQIGMRQEASRLGGIGSCGRELCCSTWLTDFRSVSTSAARYQQLSLNPSKLAGQCGKLKCCMNYELDAYMDAFKEFPNTKDKLKTEKGEAFFQKMDIFSRKMWYSFTDEPTVFIEVSLERVKEIIDINKKGKKVERLVEETYTEVEVVEPEYANVVGQDSLTRFDSKKKNNHKNKKRRFKDKRSAQNKS